MGSGRTITPTPFAVWLNDQLDQRGWGVRTLAKKINADQPEVARRALNRYLFESGRPTTHYREAIADAFEISTDEVPGGDRAPFPAEAA